MDVVTIGETMALFTSEPGPMRYASQYKRSYAGSESNFAIGLNRLGHRVGWISRVGEDELGKGLLSFIRGEGVDISQVKIDSIYPTGLMLKEIKNPEDVRIYYYRGNSAASHLSTDDLNENYIASAKYLFLSGITPALSDSCYKMVLDAIEMAKRNKLVTVFDPNLRKKLWSETKARAILLEIANKVDIVLPGFEEGKFLFEIDDPIKIGERFLEKGAAFVILKVGEKGAYYFKDDESKLVPSFKVKHMIDPVGAGDGFAAGFISGLLDGLSLYDAVRRGNAVGAIATTVAGDVEGLPEKDELFKFMDNNINDDVIR